MSLNGLPFNTILFADLVFYHKFHFVTLPSLPINMS